MSTLTHKMLIFSVIFSVILLTFGAHSDLQGQSSPKVALTGGKIITVSGAPIDGGTILIEDGIILAVGDGGMAIPYDAMEVDCTGMILAPGFVDAHNPGGLDIPNENLAVAPFVDVFDAIDPSRFFFEEALRNGVTTVHVMQGNNCVVGGVSRVVHPIGLSPDEMTRLPGLALKMSSSPKGGYDRLRHRAELRGVFSEFDRWHSDLSETRYDQESEKNEDLNPLPPEEARAEGKALIREEDLDDRHRHLAYLNDGRLAAWIHCGAATDVAPALDMIEKRGWTGRAVLVLSGDAHVAVNEIAASKVPVVLGADLIHRERDLITGDVEETFIPEVFRKKGVPFAIQVGSSNVLPERYLNYQAARLVRNGLAPEKAMRTITLGAAEICGVADHYGSIEKDKAANIVMWTGDPLEMTSWVQKVWIEGQLAYDREKDARLERLFPEMPEEDAEKSEPLSDDASTDAEPMPAENGESAVDSDAVESGDKEADEAKPEPLNKDKKSQDSEAEPAPAPKPAPEPKPEPAPGIDSGIKGGL
ncbi:MAG: amidohydrolase family protein [Planctomycetia bacterium]|nr:amidohydrolase family protein [Planctomycetia bacterium]